MSAPKRAMRNAEEIGYGFLAAKASLALQVAQQRQLSADETAVLGKAATFLNEIANGAKISKGAVLEGVRPSSSIAALNVAFGPLEILKRLIKSDREEIAPVFIRLSQAVKAVQEGADPNTLKPTLSEAQEFFDGLSGWLASEINARKRSGLRNRAGTI
jgi:hypothetical protein